MSRLAETHDTSTQRLERIKQVLEVVALALGALFLFAKVIDGQTDAAMRVSLNLERKQKPGSCDDELLTAKLGLQRSDVGRLMLSDITLEISDLSDRPRPKISISDKRITTERERAAQGLAHELWMYLPPNEGTELGYFTEVKSAAAVLVEATIVSTRSILGVWKSPQQWRVSGVSLPVNAGKCVSKTIK